MPEIEIVTPNGAYVVLVLDPEVEDVIGVRGPFPNVEAANMWAKNTDGVFMWDVHVLSIVGDVVTLECGHRVFADNPEADKHYCTKCEETSEKVETVLIHVIDGE